jgi:hypothetical protein
MLQHAVRLSDNEILLLSAIVTVSFSHAAEKAMLSLELCNHKTVSYTGEDAEEMYRKICRKLDLE